MRVALVVASLCVVASTSAVASKFQMQLNPSGQQSARMEAGVAAIDDTKPGSSVRLIQAEGDFKKRGSIALVVLNQGNKPFNFGPVNITAKLADGTPVAIITYDQLVKEEKRRQMWAAIGAGLAAAGNSMSAANAGYYSGFGSYSFSSYGSFGTTPFNATSNGTVMVSGYDYGTAQAAQAATNAQNQAMFNRMADQNAANVKALKAYMRTTTVDPGQMFGGSLFFDLPKAATESKTDVPVTFAVTINGEEHDFSTLVKRR